MEVFPLGHVYPFTDFLICLLPPFIRPLFIILVQWPVIYFFGLSLDQIENTDLLSSLDSISSLPQKAGPVWLGPILDGSRFVLDSLPSSAKLFNILEISHIYSLLPEQLTSP